MCGVAIADLSPYFILEIALHVPGLPLNKTASTKFKGEKGRGRRNAKKIDRYS